MTEKEVVDCLTRISYDVELSYPEPYYHAIHKAINMLTPKLIVGKHTNCTCPTCGRRIRSGNGSSSRVRDKRCQDCGQVIDWTEFDKRENPWKFKGE